MFTKGPIEKGPPGRADSLFPVRMLDFFEMNRNARDRLLAEATIDEEFGRLSEAEAKCRAVLDASATFLPATILLGKIAGLTGRAALAQELLGGALRLDPRSVRARTELGLLLLRERKLEDALAHLNEAVLLKSDDAETHNNLGLALLELGRFDEAVLSFERATLRKPVIAGAVYNLGIAQEALGRDADASLSYGRALALAASLLPARLRLGRLLARHGKHDEALAAFAAAVASEPNAVEPRLELARILLDVGRIDDAVRHLSQAMNREPQRAETHELAGIAHLQAGQFDAAIASFERCLAIAPARTQAYLGIAQATKFSGHDNPFVSRVSALLGQDNLEDGDRIRLHYALGKTYDDCGRYAEAMRHFDAANSIAARHLRSSRHAISRSVHSANVDRIIETFAAECFARSKQLGSDSELPILIVGMVRSGTTLVEQILSSHSTVGAGGELPFWGRQRDALLEVADGSFGPAGARAKADEYLATLRTRCPASRHVTDKMPTNFLLLGLIHLMFPQARIVHCRRDPVDTCLSIYMTPFRNFPDFAHDRGNIVYYYEEYLRLMAHWRRVLPADRFFEIDYEGLVADPGPVTRRLLDFCGLAWEDSCLRPEHNQRPIQTPSAWQARQPVYRSSVERWRRYEPFLGEFRQLVRS